ncbi:patatin-like phospholipase family protein [Candidatus Nitrospira allomarina]|uniref:Patatin-like phospholipase family protein n=1 Tax=Candidatus Nitrospira allomarina TaxID=3020900 RepID=A0AA96JTM8_9BACT|nr:patatin-like phospholipase family protein [Candidatus Nitrospira allomarina]WNM59728.1 patatin-like phospholipase family protein [Candidatus Nitrospira allomarina]
MEYDLVFEGGGAKGMVFVGAMQAFGEAEHTMGRLLGTSAGAITATLLAAGYTTQEMLEALVEEQGGQPVFLGFMGVPGPFDETEVANSAMIEFFRAVDLPLVPEFIEKKIDGALVTLLSKSKKYSHLFSFVERGGWFTAQKFLVWMEKKLNTGQVNGKARQFGGMTLLEFFQATGKELSLVASDTTGQQVLVLNHRTAPQCPIVWAVRMSMSIPLVWEEVEWFPEWGTYREHDISGHHIVDGGVLSNFPIELLVSNAPHVVAVMGEKKVGNIIGMLIDEKLPVPNAPLVPEKSSGLDFGRLKTIQRLKRLVDTMTNAHDKQIIDSLSDLVVRLPAKGYGTTEFDMTDDRRNALVAAGKQAMGDYVAAWEAADSKGIDLVHLERVQEASTRIATGILSGG